MPHAAASNAGVDIIGDFHSNLAALGGEAGSVPALNPRVLQCIGYFFGIVAYLRQGGVFIAAISSPSSPVLGRPAKSAQWVKQKYTPRLSS